MIASAYFVSSFNVVYAADFAHAQTLTVSGTATSSRVGETVAATSQYLASGSPLDDTLGADAGAVYLYEKIDETWVFQQKITATDGAAGDQFGGSLAINGTTLVVGAPYDDIGAAIDAGSVYSFDLEEGSWLQSEKLAMQTPVNYEKFGLAVDMTAARLVVGVPGYNGATSAVTFGRGALVVLDRQGINWESPYLYTYTSPITTTKTAAFGHSVAISGDKIAVGAPRDYASTTLQGNNAGSMSVLAYDSDTSTWVSEGRFHSTTPAGSDEYGTSVDIQGNTLVTANYAISTTAPKIFVYTYSAGAWSEPDVTIPAGTSVGTRYIGQSIEIAPDELSVLVGSRVSYSTSNSVGRVFVLKPNETTDVWEQAQIIASPDAPTNATWFGNDVAYAGSMPVIGSAMASAAAGTRGAIYTYALGDATPPILTLSSSSSQYLSSSYTVTIDASEPVVGFTQNDISITAGASLSDFTQITPTQFTVLVTPTVDRTYVMSIDAGMMQDEVGNNNTASAELVRTYDATAPSSIVVTPSQSTYFASPTIGVSVRISDANGGLTGLDADDISISNGTISDFSTTSNTNSITGNFVITPTSQGAIDFSVKAGAVTDHAGNDSATSATRTIYYDTDKPTPSFSTPLNPTNVSPFTVTLSFNEPVADIRDVVVGQIAASGGSIDNFQRVTAQEYTFDVTPSGVGTVTLGYAADQVNDQAGNSNNPAANYNIEFDTFGPEVTIVSTDADTNQSPIEFTVTLSESASGLTGDDFTVTNGAVDSLTQTSSTVYTVAVAPDNNGSVSIVLPAQKTTDTAGNGNQASNTAVVNYDDRRPATTVSYDYTPPVNVSPLIFTIDFSEPVDDLDAADINFTNATLVSLEKVTSRQYTLSVTPSDGLVTVGVVEGAVADAAGNTNTGGSSSLTSDRTAPTATVSTLHTSNVRPGVSGTISESADAVAVTVDGDMFNASINNTTRTWSIPAGQFGPLGDGTYDVTVTIRDIAGNVGSDTTSDELTIDTDQPVVAITPEREATNRNPVIFNLKSNRDISGLESSDFTITNGNVATIIETDPSTYVVEVTPEAQGRVTIQQKEATVTDVAGNENPASNTAELVYETVRPEITLSGTTTPTKSSSFTIIADSSEIIEDLTVGDIAVVRGNVTDVQQRADQRYAIVVEPTSEGVVSVQVPENRTVDGAGNFNLTSNTFERTYDTTPPASPTIQSQTATSRQPTLIGTLDSTNTAILRVSTGKHTYRSNDANSPIEITGNSWKLNFSKTDIRLEYGLYDVRLTAVDAAGNSSIDTTQNEITVKSPGEVLGTVDKKITAKTRPELSGTVSRKNAIVDVKILDEVYRATNNGDGSWILPADTVGPLVDGTYDVELTFVDGNLEGSDSTKNELTVDTAAPQGTFTRIITDDTSPRLWGTVDTSNTRVQIRLEGRLYDATAQSNNRWVIERGTIKPALAPGVHVVTVYLQRNDKDAMETVRRAITVRGDDGSDESPSAEENPTGSDGSIAGPESSVEQDKKEDAKDAEKDKNNVSPGMNPEGNGLDSGSDAADSGNKKQDPIDSNTDLMSILSTGVVLACVAIAAAIGSIFFLIGWKRKRKKEQDEMI